MSKFSPKEVTDLANLIKLELTLAETTKFAVEMDETLSYVKNLDELPTKNTPPTAQTTGISNRFLEENEGERTLSPEKALANAPHRKDNFFVVKGLGYAK